MDTNKKIREHISALSDGEIRDADQELALAALDTPDGREAWDLYHHIGDILRAEPSADLSPGFAEGLAALLAAEPGPGKRGAAGTPDTLHAADVDAVDAATGRVDGSTASI